MTLEAIRAELDKRNIVNHVRYTVTIEQPFGMHGRRRVEVRDNGVLIERIEVVSEERLPAIKLLFAKRKEYQTEGFENE